MKVFALSIVLIFVTISSWAQTMNVKVPNYNSFTPEKNLAPKLLDKLSSPAAKEHPEYGILPYNAPCSNCFEWLDKRTETSRTFVDVNDEAHIYSQQSQLPVCYKPAPNSPWRTIDYRLKPVGEGVYTAPSQPVPTSVDLKQHHTSLNLNGFEFSFNKYLSISYTDELTRKLPLRSVNYNTYTIGEEGLKVYNAWPGIEMHQQFRTGEVEATYVIRKPLQLPVATGYMVIEDHFTLPAGYTFTESPNSIQLADGHFQGDYELRNSKGELLAIYSKPVYFDTRVYGSLATYQLLKKDNEYTLKMFVPIEWLNRPDNVYPLYIDPVVYGVNKLGNYSQSGLAGADMGFTSEALGSCDYNMTVQVPGGSTINKAYAELEYRLTYDVACGNPALPAPFCTFSQAHMEIISQNCSTSSGIIACDPVQPPFTGTCTTDSNLVPVAAPYNITLSNPNFLGCIQQQCADYQLNFTLKNTDSICGDVCGYLCARGTMWRMTVEANASIGVPAITIHGDTLISSVSAPNQWYFNDTLIPGATGPVLNVTQTGIYSVATTDGNGCGTYMSAPANLQCLAYFTLQKLPVMDTSTYGGFNLSVGDSLHYYWEFGDGTTSTQANPTHIYNQPGYYTVCLTVSRGSCIHSYCDTTFFAYKAAGDSIIKLIIGARPVVNNIIETERNSLHIFPNPAQNNLTVSVDEGLINFIAVKDITGRQISATVCSKQTETLQVSSLPRGLYIIEVTTLQRHYAMRFIKQ